MGDNVTAPFPLLHVDLNHDPTSPTHDFSFPNHHHQFLSSRYSSSSCSHELGVVGHQLFPPPPEPHHLQRVGFDDELLLGQGGTGDHPFGEDETRAKSRVGDGDHNYSRDHDLCHLQEYCAVKWVSSKMRIMKKMSNVEKPLSAVQNLESVPKMASTVPPWVPDVLENDSSSANSHRSVSSRTESHNNNNNNPIIRVCADCNTTKTPLWRSGPTGPKTLCNACGIRQRKARRAMAAAAAAANGEVPPQQNPTPTKEQQKKKKMKKKKKRLSCSDNDNDNDGSYDPQPKKKPKSLLHAPAGSGDLRFEEFVMKLSEWTSGFRGVFPQDEKEAAILLMALSYGLVRSNNIS